MKKTMLIAAGFTLLAVSAHAETSGRAGSFGLGVGVGYNSHAMTDINKGASASITGGLDASADLKWRALENLTAGLEVELLYPQRRETSSPSSPGYKIVETYSGLAVNLGGFYTVPVGKADYRLGGSVGYYSLSGANIEFTAPTATQTVALGASGVGFKLGAGADWHFSRHGSLGFDAGYRMAKVSPLTADGKEVLAPDGTKFAVDYSGLYTKLGLTAWF